MATAKSAVRRNLTESLRALHERFVTGVVTVPELDVSAVRPVVAQSWQRSLAEGVDPEGYAPQANGGDLQVLRGTHPLAPAMPVIRQLLVEPASSSDLVAAVIAADGTLLWVEGDRNTYRRVAAMNFVPGADWSERGIGTNAPGTALALERAVQISGCEHFARIVQPWNCVAVPVHNRYGGALIGAIDLTGSKKLTSPQTLALVRATAVAVENHLELLRLAGPSTQPTVSPRLIVLGSDRSRWAVTDEHGHLQLSTLTGRHAEILVLLSQHPEGLTADHLAMLLDEEDLDPITVRAEMSRLRKTIGADFIESRPYRLLKPIASDFGDSLAALDAGDVEAALSHYCGPLLPRSVSPAIARLRMQLSTGVRGAVMSSGNLTALRRWLDTREGQGDRDGWLILHNSTRVSPVISAGAAGHLARIDLEFG